MGWWQFTRLAIEALTNPADVASCDRAMEQLTRESWLGGRLHRVSRIVRAAWLNSRARSAAASLGREIAPSADAATVRTAGWIVAVAGATILVLDAVKPVPVGPLSWMVPSSLIAAGLLLMLAAAPVARAYKVS